LLEEIDIVEKGGNYGWNVKEGTICFDAANPEDPLPDCPDTDPDGDPLIDPVITFENSEHGGGAGTGLVVVGGYVYRGRELPHLTGRYIFGTWSTSHEVPSGVVFISQPRSEGRWNFDEVKFRNTPTRELNSYLLGFGQDLKGEVYVLTTDNEGPAGHTGKVYKMTNREK
jgi:hypothetical protein